MKKFDKEIVVMIASLASFYLGIICMALMTYTEKVDNTAGFVFSLIGFAVFLNLGIYGLINPHFPKKIKN